jgi:signal recognition particle subunit SRP54
MGDVLSLVEKAQASLDEGKAEELARKLREESFTLEDFAEQLRQIQSMGPLDQLLDMVPFFKGAAVKGDLQGETRELKKYEAIIGSMTPEERTTPQIINGSRRNRIARGSGSTVQDVNRLLKQYAQLKKLMKGLKQMGGRRAGLGRALPFLR